MATKKKTTKKEETTQPVEQQEEVIAEQPIDVVNVKKPKKQKFNIGDIVYIKKDADADLNGFKLFPQYKKYTYTVEAHDEKLGVYTLRRLNLSLLLPEELVLSPDERAHDSINRRQF